MYYVVCNYVVALSALDGLYCTDGVQAEAVLFCELQNVSSFRFLR